MAASSAVAVVVALVAYVTNESHHPLQWQTPLAASVASLGPTVPPTPTPSPTPPPPAFVVPAGGVTKPATGASAFFGWSLLDTKTGKIVGHSANAAHGTNFTESMIKVWIAADYLSRLTTVKRKPTTAELTDLKNMIIHSDDVIAQRYYHKSVGKLAGYNAVIKRLNSVCGLHTTIYKSGWWSYTRMTPDDAARLGYCIANGTAAGPYTSNLLGWMRDVTGTVDDQDYPEAYGPKATTGGGRWGIVDGLPDSLAAQAAMKNGWEPDSGGEWNISCLAIIGDNVLTVMVKYPWKGGAGHTGDWRYAANLSAGADACVSVARQLTQPAS